MGGLREIGRLPEGIMSCEEGFLAWSEREPRAGFAWKRGTSRAKA